VHGCRLSEPQNIGVVKTSPQNGAFSSLVRKKDSYWNYMLGQYSCKLNSVNILLNTHD